MNILKVEQTPLSRIKLNKLNPREHSTRQLEELASSIRDFGFNVPILIDAVGEIVAGEGRYKAAKRMKLKTVPTIKLSDLDDSQARRLKYLVADNKIASMSEWDPNKLKRVLDKISKAVGDVKGTGFTDDDIARLMDDVEHSAMAGVARGGQSSRGRDDDDDDGDSGLDGGEGQTGTLGIVLTVEERAEVLEVLNEVRKQRKCMLGAALLFIVREWAAGRGSKKSTNKRGK